MNRIQVFLSGALTNIKTTIFGAIAGTGVTQGLGGIHTPDGKLNWWAIIAGLGIILKGMASKDSNVTGGSVHQ
jgi:hypothetical protein